MPPPPRIVQLLALSFPIHALVTGSAAAQCAPDKIVSSTPQESGDFGSDLALDGDWAAIGARNEPGPTQYSGAVHLYERIGGDWIERQVLTSPVGGTVHEFGASVALDEDWLAVGDPEANVTGQIYLYERVAGSWVYRQEIHPASGSIYDDFGAAVALDDGVLVGGAPLVATGFSLHGAAFVFRLTGGIWNEEATLLPPTSWKSARFGSEVDIEGDRIVVAGPYAWLGNLFSAGASRVYDHDGQDWVVSGNLITDDFMEHDQVGRDGVALSGDTIVAAGWLASNSASGSGFETPGHVYVFELEGGLWSQSAKLEASDATNAASFGSDVDIDQDRMVIGARSDPEMGLYSGALYVFERVGGIWSEREKRHATDGYAGDVFGISVAMNGDTAFAAGININDPVEDAGGVHTFDLTQAPTPPARPYCYGDEGCPCNNGDGYAGCANSTHIGARLRMCGSLGVGADDLTLRVDQAPLGQFGLVFMGAGQPDLAFGGGRLCVGAGGVGLFRFPVRNTGNQGTFSESGLVQYATQMFPAAGQIVAGSTWRFQAWFRDPALPPCSGPPSYISPGNWAIGNVPVPDPFNLSNALEVTFGP